MNKFVLFQKVIAWVAMSLGFAQFSSAQCNNSNLIGTNRGLIIPSINWQTIPGVMGGDYYTFLGIAGTPYSFSFCLGGGEATWDTQITICDNLTALVDPGQYSYDDDLCAFAGGSHIAYWTPSITKTYRVFVTKYNCITYNSCAILAYKQENIPGTGNTCAAARNITLPYDGLGLATCNRGNTYDEFDACGSTYMDGEDMVFKFAGTTGQCISIITENTFPYTGLFLCRGCPDVGSCVAYDEEMSGWPSLTSIILPANDDYYIIVSTEPTPDCTPFDIHVMNCPPAGVGSTCGSAYVIPSIPFYGNGFTTCGRGNAYTSAYSCASNFMNGEDYVFAYFSLGGECVDVRVTNPFVNTGLFVTYGCPTVGGGNCVDKVEDISGDPSARFVSLTLPGWYYFIVSTNPAPGCTPFDIRITPCAPLCGLNPIPGDFCGVPTLLSPLTTFCGTTSPFPLFTPDGPGNLPVAFCGSIENNSWFSFVAPTTTVDFQIIVSNCANGLGIQAEIFSTPDCNTFTPVSTCYNPMGPWNGHLIASGLTIGNTYYLMLDGYAADECDYRVSINVCGPGPLPVTMTHLKGTLYDNIVKLSWSTFSESNNKGFYIQRGIEFDSPEKLSIQWENVGFLEGNGTTSKMHNYDFDEIPPFRTQGYFYRIMQMDHNGMNTFSEIIHLDPLPPEEDMIVNLFPNPTQEHLVLTYELVKDEDVSITITDVTGVVVRSKEMLNESAGSHEMEFELGDLSSGIYFLSLKGSFAPKVNKFSLIK